MASRMRGCGSKRGVAAEQKTATFPRNIVAVWIINSIFAGVKEKRILERLTMRNQDVTLEQKGRIGMKEA